MSGTVRLRSFREFCDAGIGVGLLQIDGRIEPPHFVVATLGHEIPMKTIEIGRDAGGSFAIVEEGERVLSDGFELRVEPEYDEELQVQSGGHITVFLEGEGGEKARAALRGSGTEVDSVILLVPVARSFDLYFDPDGAIEQRSAASEGLEGPRH